MGEQPSTRTNQCNEQQQSTLHGGILRQARDNPGAIAVVEVEKETCRHTFADLTALALAIRHAMPLRKTTEGTQTVGVLAEGGGLALYSSWLAVLWEGYTVVPLSAEASAERLDSIISDATATVVLLADEGGAAAWKRLRSTEIGRAVSVVDVPSLKAAEVVGRTTSGEDFTSVASSETEATAASRDAYLYYTSGSSGEPKGVFSGHAPMTNRLRWMWRRWPFAKDEVCCQRVDHTFIDFVAEVFGPLSCGVPLLVVPSTVRRNPVLLRDFISDNGVTRITLVPTLARLVVEAATVTSTVSAPRTAVLNPVQQLGDNATTTAYFFRGVRLWILSGEALPWSVARGLARLSSPKSTLLNLYGSTEVAADITFHSWNCAAIVERGGAGDLSGSLQTNGVAPSVPIGRPIANCGVELLETVQLDRGGVLEDGPPSALRKIAPNEYGRVGALYVCGAGLARGYWRRPAVTENCFPCYTWDSGSSLYRLCSSSTRNNHRLDLLVSIPLCSDDQNIPGSSSDGVVGHVDRRTTRFFRTGDLASFERRPGGADGTGCDEDWDLVYRGRLDQQIKINGRRLDLGEVEACLLRVHGVALGTAVSLCREDVTPRQEGGDEEDLGPASSYAVGVMVSPQIADTAAVLAECRRFLPKFAVPQVVVTATAIPTLPGSGKVDRRKVRSMVLEASHRCRDRRRAEDNANDSIGGKTGARQSIAGGEDDDVEKMVNIIKAAVGYVVEPHGVKGWEKKASTSMEITHDSDLFADVGFSSQEAVRIVHELRRRLSPAGGMALSRVQPTVRLVDLYAHPTARSLAKWLAGPLPMPNADEEGQSSGAHPDGLQEKGSVRSRLVVGSSTRSVNGGARGTCEAPVVGANIRPITADVRAETSTLFSDVFLNGEPLIAARLKRCRAKVGPVGAMILRQCYRRLVGISFRSILERGGRVLIATDEGTGRVIGFTIGTELVESIRGLGFFTSSFTEEGSGENEECARQSSTDTEGIQPTLWHRFSLSLLGNLLKPMTRPVTELVKELLGIYRSERGWAYEPGEIMYISETGCLPNERCTSEPRGEGGRRHEGASACGSAPPGGGAGMRAAVLAESLERRLLCDATAAGFDRAVTICTNAVTVHIARELGFREVARISPVQTYLSPAQQATGRQPGCFPRVNRKSALRYDGSPSAAGAELANKTRRPGPFAGVATEHANAILFEKVLVPGVPPELLLDNERHESTRGANATSRSTAKELPATSADSVFPVVVAGGQMWKIASVGQASWEHRRQMLALVASVLPELAASGRATKYMVDDIEQGQAARILLTAPERVRGGNAVPKGTTAAALGGGEGRHDLAADEGNPINSSRPLLSSATTWSVAACMSWRRTSGANDLGKPETLGTEETIAKNWVSDGKGRSLSGSMTSAPSLELLVLAVGRRWRYRGLGSALIARMLANSRRDGDSHVLVRSLTESVPFYERHGFRRTATGGLAGGEGDAAESVPVTRGECVLVHDLGRSDEHA